MENTPQTNGKKAHSKPQDNAQWIFEAKEYKFMPQSKNSSQGRTESKREK